MITDSTMIQRRETTGREECLKPLVHASFSVTMASARSTQVPALSDLMPLFPNLLR